MQLTVIPLLGKLSIGTLETPQSDPPTEIALLSVSRELKSETVETILATKTA